MPGQKNAEEIDLIDLLLKGINTFRANFWLILVFFLVGSGLGLAYFLASKKVFEDRMIISSGILTESYSKILMKNANRHNQEGNTKLLMDQFHISEKTVKAITNLQIENLNDAEANDAKETDRFMITVSVLDRTVLPELQKGLIYYFENNPFVKTRVEQNRKFLKEMIAHVGKEIEDMEKFKQSLATGDFFQRAKGTTIMLDPTTVNVKILELNEKKIGYENSLQLSSSVQVIDGFNGFEKEATPKLSISIIAGSVVGLVFVGLLIAFKSIRKLLSLADAAK